MNDGLIFEALNRLSVGWRAANERQLRVLEVIGVDCGSNLVCDDNELVASVVVDAQHVGYLEHISAGIERYAGLQEQHFFANGANDRARVS